MESTGLKQQRNGAGESAGMVVRRDSRRAVNGFTADIAGSVSLVTGGIDNISKGGFKISAVPDSFTGSKHSYNVVLNGDGHYYRLVAKPCWKNKSAERGCVDIGFKILDAPWEWVDLHDLGVS